MNVVDVGCWEELWGRERKEFIYRVVSFLKLLPVGSLPADGPLHFVNSADQLATLQGKGSPAFILH